jgi:hypothetical protein
MRSLAIVVLAAVAESASAGADPIAECRAAHGSDAAAHIACLEDALRTRVPSPAAPVVASDASAPPEPTGLGAEQAKAHQRPLDAAPERVDVRIVSSGYNAEGLGTFRMADGQVWRETTPAPKRYKLKPSQEYVGRIETSKIGGYRLYIEGKTWMFKVERLK